MSYIPLTDSEPAGPWYSSELSAGGEVWQGLPVSWIRLSSPSLWPIIGVTRRAGFQRRLRESLQRVGQRNPLVAVDATTNELRLFYGANLAMIRHLPKESRRVLALVIGNQRYWAMMEAGVSRVKLVVAGTDIREARCFTRVSQNGWDRVYAHGHDPHGPCAEFMGSPVHTFRFADERVWPALADAKDPTYSKMRMRLAARKELNPAVLLETTSDAFAAYCDDHPEKNLRRPTGCPRPLLVIAIGSGQFYGLQKAARTKTFRGVISGKHPDSAARYAGHDGVQGWTGLFS